MLTTTVRGLLFSATMMTALGVAQPVQAHLDYLRHPDHPTGRCPRSSRGGRPGDGVLKLPAHDTFSPRRVHDAGFRVWRANSRGGGRTVWHRPVCRAHPGGMLSRHRNELCEITAQSSSCRMKCSASSCNQDNTKRLPSPHLMPASSSRIRVHAPPTVRFETRHSLPCTVCGAEPWSRSTHSRCPTAFRPSR